ncbi:hypothetical protein GCM10022402_14470 [Salinactinospora qingdaonensis]|uniref:Uncharacterized protein n=1 Tax=Salinactinospora qingdaonensis TaxID=702744 RepID=A0ABP7FBH6_9ACTN
MDSATSGSPLTTRETVFTPTPASEATSRIVARRVEAREVAGFFGFTHAPSHVSGVAGSSRPPAAPPLRYGD